MDTLRSLRNLPFHKMQPGAAALISQSGSTLDIATGVCSCSNCVIGFVNQHRVLSLMEGPCRTANSCKAGKVVGASRIACDGWSVHGCQIPHNPGCFLGCHEGLDCIRRYNRCPTLFESLCSLWPGTGECISPTAIFNDLLFKIAFRSDRLCILVAGLLSAFVTAYNVRRTNRSPDLDFKELMYGRIKMMTALCPTWAHTYQTMCLGFHLEHLRPEAFGLPKRKKKFTMLPTCRTTTRMTGIESPGWRLFPYGCIKRQIDCSNNTAELTFFAESLE